MAWGVWKRMLEDEDGWHPATVARATNADLFHPYAPPSHKYWWSKIEGELIYVRPVARDKMEWAATELRALGCMGEVYWVRPKDATRLRHRSDCVACEHEVIID
jgi:hypothetical protein